MTFSPLNYSILAVYLTVMFGCGVYFAGRQRTTDDYFLAGRRMPWLIVAMSMFASLTSATSYMGLPGRAQPSTVDLSVFERYPAKSDKQFAIFSN